MTEQAIAQCVDCGAKGPQSEMHEVGVIGDETEIVVLYRCLECAEDQDGEGHAPEQVGYRYYGNVL